MKYLVIKNYPIEGPGILKEILKGEIREITAEDLGSEDFDSLIIMGGPMGVYESDKFPFLSEEIKLIQDAFRNGKRILGICLGAQLLSKALGGNVVKGSFGQEIGIREVKFVNELYFLGNAKVFQWHGDTFSLPPNAELLAYSEKYFQAFRLGRALGLQFHVEVNSDIVKEWINEYGGNENIINEVKENEKQLHNIAEKIIDYWIKL
jgi:GMP synthase-like glutamine amidotransferase